MHELSIANRLIEIAIEHASEVDAKKICSIGLRVGALSCVHQDALQFSFEMVARQTIAEGATLHINLLPVRVFCPTCDEEVELPGIQRFRCPRCDTPTADIRQGKELDIESIEVLEKRTC